MGIYQTSSSGSTLMWGRLFEHVPDQLKNGSIQLAVLCAQQNPSLLHAEVTLTPQTVSIALPDSIVDMHAPMLPTGSTCVVQLHSQCYARPYMGDYSKTEVLP